MAGYSGYFFWRNFDRLLGGRSLKQVTESAGVNYPSTTNQRSLLRVPSDKVIDSLAKALGVEPEAFFCTAQNETVPFRLRPILAKIAMLDDTDLGAVDGIVDALLGKKREETGDACGVILQFPRR